MTTEILWVHPPAWLPEGGGARDFFADQRGTVELLESLVHAEEPSWPRQQAEEAAEDAEPLVMPVGYTADQLQRVVFPVPRWAVPGLLTEGATILSGRPKLGKSWLGLHLCVEVSRGGLALGRIRVEPGEALYLALEDGMRRVKERLNYMLGDDPWPSGLTIMEAWPKIDDPKQAGLAVLAAWLDAHPACRLVVIDTFKRIRARSNLKGRLYDDDYDALEPLTQLGRSRRCAIVPVMHNRKGASDDPLELISGTTGASGGVDAALVLRRERGQADASLFSTGRDVDERDLALKWSKDDFTWTWLGDADEFRQSKERSALLALIAQTPGLKPKELADALHKNGGAVRYLLFKLAHEGSVRLKGDGTYWPGIDNPTQAENDQDDMYSTPNSANSPSSAHAPTVSPPSVSPVSPVSPVGGVGTVSGTAQQPRTCEACNGPLPHQHQRWCNDCFGQRAPL